MENEQSHKSKKLFFIKIALYAILAIVVLGLAGSSFYFYRQYKKSTIAENEGARNEISILTDEIAKFMELPEETPTLATVADENKIKDQPFFAKAQNGDKVLIYAKAQKAILYRPATKKIIEVSAFFNSPQQKEEIQDNQKDSMQEENLAEKKQSLEIKKVIVYNGSNIKGLAARLAEKIKDLDNIEIIEKTNAKGNYDTTFVVDLTKKNLEIAQKIADILGADVKDFPENEIMPQADILVIGGKNENK